MMQKLFNLIILDECGSMSGIGKRAIGAVNETIQIITHRECLERV